MGHLLYIAVGVHREDLKRPGRLKGWRTGVAQMACCYRHRFRLHLRPRLRLRPRP